MFFKSLLAFPSIYTYFQNFLLNKNSTFFHELVGKLENIKLLDIGCGPASILSIIPNSVEYHGFDVSEKYISDAREKFKDRKAFFKCIGVNAEDIGSSDFDQAIAVGVLHHLDDQTAIKLMQIAFKALKKGARLITVDVVLLPHQNIIAKTMAKLDRGKFVRQPDQYRLLAESIFKDRVKIEYRHDTLRIPYDHIIMTMEK